MQRLTPEMKRAVEYMRKHGGKIERFAGGYWTNSATASFRDTFGSSTISALVKRDVAKYVEFRAGRYGEFPIRAELVPAQAVPK